MAVSTSRGLNVCDIRLRKHSDTIAQVYPEHDRWRSTSQASTILGGLQPVIAWLGLLGCLVIVLVFTTATWWSTPVDFNKVVTAFSAVRNSPAVGVLRKLLTSETKTQPVILTAFFLVLKLVTWRSPVCLDNDCFVLAATFEHLRFLKPERQRGSRSDGNTNKIRRMRGFLTSKKRSRSGQNSSTRGEVGLEAI